MDLRAERQDRSDMPGAEALPGDHAAPYASDAGAPRSPAPKPLAGRRHRCHGARTGTRFAHSLIVAGVAAIGWFGERWPGG
ncbi:hypothetical protein P0F65_04345 [Sphingomonas sp. I4]